jgi:hypothetical protein
MKWINARNKPRIGSWVIVWDQEEGSATMAKLSAYEDCWIYAENLNDGDDVEYVCNHCVTHWAYLPGKPDDTNTIPYKKNREKPEGNR